MEVQSLFNNIFIVALSETEGTDKNSGEVTSCEVAKSNLKRIIATGNVLEIQDEVSSEKGFFETEEFLSGTNNTFTLWTQSIADQVQSKISKENGDRDNLQYLPEIVTVIIKFAKTLPLW